MQIARPHTRFFRLVYDSPKQSDILCGINIRIHIVSAISALERLVSSCADTVHTEQVCEVYAGSTTTKGTPAILALYSIKERS